MKKVFEDNSYIEISIGGPGKVEIILGSRDSQNPLKLNISSAKITIEDLTQLIKELGLRL
jgi:hypothetical protein